MIAHLLALVPALGIGLVGPSADWQLVRSESPSIGPLSWERVGEVYLDGRSWELVDADAGNPRPETSRMVVGSPADNRLVAALAKHVGVTFEEGRLVFQGERQPTGTGFASYGLDPDGGGILFLVCGADPAGVLANFQTTLGLGMGEFALTHRGRRLRKASLERRFDLTQPRVVRLDLDFLYLLDSAPDEPGERALRVARGLVGYAHVFKSLGVGDLLPFAEQLLANELAIKSARKTFAERDPGRDVLKAYRACAELLDLQPESTPAFYVLFGLPGTSNAKNFGTDPVTGRRQVLFNLTALATGRHYESALIHESVHTFQDLSGTRLLDRAMVEGVATLLSQLLTPDLPDADALLWSPEQLSAAEAQRTELIEAFAQVADSTDRQLHGPWMNSGSFLTELPTTPSRCAYYVAWLAARSWLAASSEREPADLLRVSSDELLAALR